MWRSSDPMNSSLLEGSDCDSSEIVNSNDVNLKINQSLEISLYENTPTETPSCDHDSSLQLHPLNDETPSSKESGYNTSEYLHANQGNNDSFCDHISNFDINEPLHDQILEFCESQKLGIQLELPMDFSVLLNKELTKESVLAKAESKTTPTLTLYKRKKRPLASDEDLTTDKLLKTSKTVNESTPEDTNSEVIKRALHRSMTEPNLTGDFSKTCFLPVVAGRHQDLKTITASTMSLLLKGDFSQDVSFKIIDCRYPYEYEGGHIEGAINLYTKNMLIEALLNKSALTEAKPFNKRYILIFHCEFSSNRAPTLYRFLRNFDRNYNEHLYPTLFYPEIYLLEGGYKEFYFHYSNLCLPTKYVPMNHPEHCKNLSFYREKTKSNNELFSKANNKRLNFF